MPTLNWIGKEAVVNHHLEVPFHLLKDVPDLSCGDPGTGNLIVEGDNLLALKALLPYYAGQVKCIYIDPPYNTGMDGRNDEGKRVGWVYSDNINRPELQAWFDKEVGLEGEDLSRHDKWLCMMYPRLQLLKKFLLPDGVIFVSLDEIEFAHLRVVLDEVFGASNRVGTIVWKNATDNNPTQIATEHEYVMCYALEKSRLPREWKSPNLAVKQKLLEIGDEFIQKFSQDKRQDEYSKWFRKNKDYLWPFDRYKFIDDGGVFTGSQSVHNPGKEGYRYDVLHPISKKPCTQPLMGYRFPEETMKKLIADGRIIFGEDETKLVELKVYARDFRSKLSSFFELDGRVGTNQIKEIFPEDKRPFDFPKPVGLIEELISFVTDKEDIILDSFAGSGTTGHSVLKLNSEDDGKRRFVLVEREPEIATGITSKRIRRVAEGYKNSKAENIKGFGGGFRYCQLSERPMFTAQGKVDEDVRFADLARHVYFTETGEPLPRERVTKSPLIGVHHGTGVYLLYNGILGDRSSNGGNILTRPLYAKLPPHDGLKVIYAAGCLLGRDWLRANQITFRQTPYEIKVS
jgi:adenine-specific DNA-methyltransferase